MIVIARYVACKPYYRRNLHTMVLTKMCHFSNQYTKIIHHLRFPKSQISCSISGFQNIFLEDVLPRPFYTQICIWRLHMGGLFLQRKYINNKKIDEKNILKFINYSYNFYENKKKCPKLISNNAHLILRSIQHIYHHNPCLV